jgi:hypothetical protein
MIRRKGKPNLQQIEPQTRGFLKLRLLAQTDRTPRSIACAFSTDDYFRVTAALARIPEQRPLNKGLGSVICTEEISRM